MEAVELGFSLADLEIKKLGLEDRIKRLEADLKQPLEHDNHDQAQQLSNQIILRRLLEVEKSYLRKVNFELEKRKQAQG
jgi:RNA polymerase-binding transcription factor DksA